MIYYDAYNPLPIGIFMIKLFPLSLTLFVLSTSTFAANITIHTFGEPSCGNWVQDRENANRARQAVDIPNQSAFDLNNALFRAYEADRVVYYDFGWVQGFLTGYPDGAGREYFKQQQPDLNSIKLYIDNYCAQNPLKRLTDAGEALVSNFKK